MEAPVGGPRVLQGSLQGHHHGGLKGPGATSPQGSEPSPVVVKMTKEAMKKLRPIELLVRDVLLLVMCCWW